MAVYAGRKGVIYASTTGTGTAINVLNLSSWSIDLTRETLESTSFGDVNRTYVVGLPDTTGEFEGFWNDAETKLFAAAASADGCKLYLYPSSDAPTKFFSGPAWLDISLTTAVDELVEISGTFSANGAWSNTLAS